MNYTYILECSDGTFYVGWTNNLKKRIKTHNQGKGARYTRGRTPVNLVYWEEYDSRSDAQKREITIKNYSRKEKERLINESIHGNNNGKSIDIIY